MSKSAMQEMLLNIESIESKTTNQEQLYMLTSLKVSAMVLLEKEKEQMLDAIMFHNTDPYSNLKIYAEQYLNIKYNQKQHIIDIMKADEEDGLYNENK
jgi:hypothetical protein